MNERIAFCTLGVLKAPVGDPAVQGFVNRLDTVYVAAEGSAGFFDRSIRDVETWSHSWGPIKIPRCAPAGVVPEQLAMTLSLWVDLTSVSRFAYRGLHGEALSKRNDWFASGSWPAYVAWWVDADQHPSWSEAAERLDLLHEMGPTPQAFTFRQAFDPAGMRIGSTPGRGELSQ
jgi:hypothetical protein